MKEKPNRKKLIAFMDEHGLTTAEVASLLEREIVTIQAYRARSGMDIPRQLLELLEYKVLAK